VSTPKEQTDQFIATASRAELQRVLAVLLERSMEAWALAYQQIPAPGTYELAEPEEDRDQTGRAERAEETAAAEALHQPGPEWAAWAQGGPLPEPADDPKCSSCAGLLRAVPEPWCLRKDRHGTW
jgi:hypothetical protein